MSTPRTRLHALGVLVTLPLAVGLGVWDRVLVGEDDAASERLTTTRIHIEQVTSLRRDTRKVHVALLESWLTPLTARAARRAELEALLATVKAAHEAFHATPHTTEGEPAIRERLATAHRAWNDLTASTLANGHGAEHLEAHRAALARFDEEADAMLVHDSAVGEAVDRRIAEIRARHAHVERAFLATLLASVGMALLWRARARADERVRDAKQREEARVAELRRQFFASVSHELRTPLVSITNLTTSFDEATSTPETRAKLTRHIEGEAKELLGMINNILDLAKLESAHAEFLVEDLALAAVVERCVSRCRPLLGDAPIELHVDVPPELLVRADFVKLQQVFTNLLANAIKFTDAGSVTVRARRAAGRVEVEVSDTGIGMSPDALSTIWSPFRQGGEGTSRKYGGTGLGLAIVKGVLDRVGGEVRVRSTLGEGTTFVVSLPVGASRDEPTPVT